MALFVVRHQHAPGVRPSRASAQLRQSTPRCSPLQVPLFTGHVDPIRFERSLSLADAGGEGVLLTYAMNGEPSSTAIHSGHRPGWYAEPAPNAELPNGDTVIRGVAWFAGAPIARVEVCVGDDDWREARLVAEWNRLGYANNSVQQVGFGWSSRGPVRPERPDRPERPVRPELPVHRV